jgi:hypothetical protein
MEDVEMQELLAEGLAAAGWWAVWMGVFSRSWMKLLAAGGLSYKRARIVAGEILAPSYLSAGVLWRRLGMRGLLERAPGLWLSGGESWGLMFGSVMPWTNDRLGAGSLRSTSCLQTSGGNATRRRVARKRWSEWTGPPVLGLPLLRGVLELLL